MSLTTLSAATALANFSLAGSAVHKPPVNTEGHRFKISLNAYSFNELLKNGNTSLEALLTFCAENNFDAIDLTAYYFPGYPQIPLDAYIFDLKRKAHRLGLAISGTGIRNEFADPGKAKRAVEVDFVKRWIEVAA